MRAWLWFLAIMPVILNGQCFGEDELPPVDLQVYYSAADTKWSATEKSIDVVCKKFPRLRLEKVAIDTPEGYKRLEDTEKRLNLVEPGEVTLVMGPFHLEDKGEKRDIETYFEGYVKRVFNPDAAKGKRPADTAGYAKEIFGDGVVLDGNADDKDHIAYFQVLKGGHRVGWVMDAFQHIHCPICNDTQFLMAVGEPGLNVLDMRPVRALERRGVLLDKNEGERFLNQFKGRSASERLDKKPRVDIISGATNTSLTYEGAVNEILTQLKARAQK